MNNKPVIAILLGDAAGVGAEIVAKTLANKFYENICYAVIIGDRRIFERALSIIGESVDLQFIMDMHEAKWEDGKTPFLCLNNIDPKDAVFSVVNEKCGKASLEQLEVGTKLFKEGLIDGFVFAPLNKAAMIMAGSNCESEQEYLANLFGHEGSYGEINVVDNVCTTRVSSHIPISKVSEHITFNNVMKAIVFANQALKRAGIGCPRIGVAALNPHCGESGKCGVEEIEVIEPSVKKAAQEGINVIGPISSDVLFVQAFDGKFDGIVTMYHDQGQIALKLRGFDRGVTIVGGLPAPIATCAHGTAFDIAGKGIVKTMPFEAAVKIVLDMCSNKI